MTKTTRAAARILALTLVAALATSGMALADPSHKKSSGKPDREERHHSQDDHESGYSDDHHGDDHRGHRYFSEQRREIIHNYYEERYRDGKCPPGLAKKHNGCFPPGQAKKWRIGHALPRDVIFYDLPPAIIVQLGTPPAGHRFVRVASDILMIAVGTGIVIDAIEDLGRL